MKKFLTVVLTLCLIFVGITFAGCGVEDISLSGQPELSDMIFGNGGLVVQKGEYIYFASGFVNSEKMGLSFSNAKGSVNNGGLYRAKIKEITVGEGESAITKKEITDPELMVSKIVGFKDGGIYIFKNKIYFSSPSIVQDSSGVRYDLITFFSCNLDGSNLKKFYQTKTWKKDTSTFSMTMIEEKVYLLIHDNSEILKIDENGKVKILVTETKSVLLPKYENIINPQDNPTLNNQFVYFTKDTQIDGPISTGQTLYKFDIVSETRTELFKDSINKIKINLLELKADRIFYTRTSEYSEELSYYSNSLEGSNFLNSEIRHTYNSFSNPTSLGKKENISLGIVFINDSKLYLKSLTEINDVTQLVSSISSILGVHNGYVYYVSGSDIYRIDSTEAGSTKKEISRDLTPLKTFCDWDMDFCYFLAEDSSAESGYSMYAFAYRDIADSNSAPQKIA